MSTFPSPVSVSEFQSYLRDTTTDVDILAFYASLLDTATEKVYTYLDRDYTASAVKTDVFFGKGLHVHRMKHPAGALISWKYYDESGTETIADTGDLVLFANGEIAAGATAKFSFGYEHRLKYSLALSLVCPEAVKQVILETAAIIYEESKLGGARLGIGIESDRGDANIARYRYLDLSERQKGMLQPYKRYAV
ncbi:MAG: hypothetical protein ABI778_04835 [Ignavibacteriota bacterium]